jgi:hypothetical protein
MTKKYIPDRLTEYRASEEFKEDFAMYRDLSEAVNISEPDEQIIIELMRTKSEQLEAADICEQEGHLWSETAYPEDGMSDLECERCGEFQTISFTA